MLQNQIGLSVCDFIIKRRTKSGESEEKIPGTDAFRFSCDFRSALTLGASDSCVCACERETETNTTWTISKAFDCTQKQTHWETSLHLQGGEGGFSQIRRRAPLPTVRRASEA